MSRVFQYALCAVLLIGLLPLGVLLGLEYALSGATTYCPRKHKLNMDQHCRVVDRQKNRTLVHHFNVDTNALELSIHEDGRTIWIQHPEETEYFDSGRSVFENTIGFDPNDTHSILVNGHKFPIKEILPRG